MGMLWPGYCDCRRLGLTILLDAENREDKFVTNLETNSTPAEAAMGAQWLMIVEWRYIQCGRLGDRTPKTWTQVFLSDTQNKQPKKVQNETDQQKKSIYSCLSNNHFCLP